MSSTPRTAFFGYWEVPSMLRMVLRLVAVLSGFLSAAGAAQATIVTFDDLDATAGDVALDALSPYAGLSWTNFFAYTTTPGFDGFNNGIVSPSNAAYSGGQLSGTAVTPIIGGFSGPSLFDFTSAYLGAGYYDNLLVTVKGMRGGSLLYSQGITVGTAGASLFTFNFTGVDTVLFEATVTGLTTDPFGCGTFNCTQFTIDDLSVDISTNSVPEPGTLALVGVAALALARRRRAK